MFSSGPLHSLSGTCCHPEGCLIPEALFLCLAPLLPLHLRHSDLPGLLTGLRSGVSFLQMLLTASALCLGPRLPPDPVCEDTLRSAGVTQTLSTCLYSVTVLERP